MKRIILLLLCSVGIANAQYQSRITAAGIGAQPANPNLDGWATKTPFAGTLLITTGKQVSITNALTLSGNDVSTLNIGAGGTLGSNAFNSTAFGNAQTANPLSQFAATTSAQLLGVISDETGSGAAVFATSPTLVTPNLGAATATSINGVDPAAGFIFSNAPVGAIFSITKTGVDLKTVAATDIFTVPAGKTFYLLDCQAVVASTSGATLGPTFGIIENGGSNALTTVSATSTNTATWMLTVGKVLILPRAPAATVQNIVGCTAGNKVQVNVSTGATTTTLTADVTVIGYYR